MSKVTRIVLATLVSLGIIAAIFTNVQARLGNLLPNRSAVAADQSLGRTSFYARGTTDYQFEDFYKDSSGGCDHSNPSTDD